MAKHKKRRIRPKHRYLHTDVSDQSRTAADQAVIDDESQSTSMPLTPTSRIVRVDVPFQDAVSGVAAVEVYGCISMKRRKTGLLFRLKVDGKGVMKPVAQTRSDGSLELQVPGLDESRAMQRALDLAMRIVGGSLKQVPPDAVVNSNV